MNQQVCYCFGYTVADLEKDVEKHGRSTIMTRIMAEKKAGACKCADKNPKGRWCLADVRQVVDQVMQKHGMKKPIDLQSL